MSRGHGRWQRALLAALNWHAIVSVIDVVHTEIAEPSRADLVAARRAARRLAEAGQLRAVYLTQCGECREVYGAWRPCCGRGTTHVLVVTKVPYIDTVKLRRLPKWISVAPASALPEALPEATLRPAVGTGGGS